MAVTLTSDINSSYWSLSISEEGGIVTDFEDLKQQVLVALSTDKGSVPLDPEFGFNIQELLDRPVNFVIPNGKLEILATLERDVPSITVESIAHRLDELSHVTFFVLCSTNLGNFVIQVPINQNFTPSIGGGFSGGFSGGFN